MSKSKIDRKAIIEKELKNRHIFSDKHLENGIMNLGNSKEAIMNSGFDKIDGFINADLSKPGQNVILTKLNGYNYTFDFCQKFFLRYYIRIEFSY